MVRRLQHLVLVFVLVLNNGVLIQYIILSTSRNTEITCNLPVNFSNTYYTIGCSASSRISICAVFERTQTSFLFVLPQISEKNSVSFICIGF